MVLPCGPGPHHTQGTSSPANELANASISRSLASEEASQATSLLLEHHAADDGSSTPSDGESTSEEAITAHRGEEDAPSSIGKAGENQTPSETWGVQKNFPYRDVRRAVSAGSLASHARLSDEQLRAMFYLK